MLKRLFILSFIPFFVAAEPTQFKDVTSLMTEYNDYSPDIGAFKVLSNNPLKIQISPKIIAGESAESIRLASYKASVYAAYRTLLQTPANKVEVTVLPLSFDLSTSEKSYLKDYKFSFSLTKAEALELTEKTSGIKSANQIIDKDGYEWTAAFESCCYRESGKPGLIYFVNEMTK